MKNLMMKLNFNKYKELISYGIVGVLTTLVSLISYYICVSFFFNPENNIQLQIANVISWILSVTFAYFTNRKYVFKSKETNKIKEGFEFYISRISTLLIDMFMMFILVSLMGINNKISKLVVQVVIFILNYLFSKLFVFRKSK